MARGISAHARLALAVGTAGALALSLAFSGGSVAAAKSRNESPRPRSGALVRPQPDARRRRTPSTDTVTPVKHLVVLFQENVPFDHYFGTYPHAANPPGEPRFEPAPGTPTVNGYNE